MLIRQPHHDGSELYVSSQAPQIGERVTFKIRCPQEEKFESAFIRIFHDGEPRTFAMKKIGRKSRDIWWSVSVRILNPSTHYRFLLVREENYKWLNGLGVHEGDVTDREDFQILAIPGPPTWIRSSVFYQIFPDRFANSGAAKNLPDWAIPRDWNSLPHGRDKTTGQEFYGGDFDGVTSKISYIKGLGVNAIYFTPTFPARSNHRYDASSFDEIDPLLGGDLAFLRFLKVARKEKLRILSDLTTNHCGAGHRWIQRALKDPKVPERDFFYWDKKIKHGYVGWWGLASLPKLNYNSRKLRELMYEGKKSVVQKWLSAPYKLDGWRIDVGNMTGRYLTDDLNSEVTRGIRKSLDEVNSNAWLVAENADHLPQDLDGFGWHGTMNYNGFARPLVNWFNDNENLSNFTGLPGKNPKFTGNATAQVMRAFAAGIPWRSFVASMVLLDSHDTARFRTVVSNSRNKHLAAVTLLMTYPGVPSIFAGDELGLEGEWGEDARRTINWECPEGWDHELLSEFKKLIAIRRKRDALKNGGIRWIASEEDYMAYLRESKSESLLIISARSAAKISIDLGAYGYSIAQTLYGPSGKGSSLTLNSRDAISGIWKLK
jgi:alpha-glucosidase